MRASIVMAAHNEGDRLWRTVRSCYATVKGLSFEVVVVDDASTDGCADEVRRRFPQARLVRHRERWGASAAKDHAARLARGEVLVFLDAHSKPERDAIARLVAAVLERGGDAIIQPRIRSMDARTWRTNDGHQGYGYTFDLKTFKCGWARHDRMWIRGRYLECPSLAGGAFALSRKLYRKLRGFDPDMLQWGYEDNDLGLKSWLLGHPILMDPQLSVGHVFSERRVNYRVEPESIAVNKLRAARKNFTDEVWREWLARYRARRSPRRWRKIWRLYKEREASVERERRHLFRHRVRDEFWYAEKFRLKWPRR
jgi:GT2 family glycosyltransferase